MMLIGFVILLVAHFVTGSSLLLLLRIKLERIKYVALSFIAGIVIISWVPFILQLLHLSITLPSVSIGIALLVLIGVLIHLKYAKDFSFASIKWMPSFKLYEWPFMILFAFLFLSSVWRAYYLPPSSRDVLSGPEAIAEYTVREHTMINSIFTVNLETTNNHQKPPFVSCLQVVYKLYGFVFGQMWISIMSVAFMVFLYQLLKEKVHGLIACTLILFFLTIPEIFAYTYVILFDYSNMVLFFLGFYFLWRYFQSSSANEFYLSAILFGFATYIRLETLILVGMLLPAIWLNGFRLKIGVGKLVFRSILLMFISYFFYFMWVNIYLKYYMPGGFNVASAVTKNLKDVSVIWTRLVDMNEVILFGIPSQSLWGYYIYLFLIVFVAELIFLRKLSRESRNWLYGVLVIFIGLPFIGYLLPLADIKNTTKRGLFKMMPLMLMVMANSGLLQKLSQILSRSSEPQPEKAKPESKPVAKTTVKGGKTRNGK